MKRLRPHAGRIVVAVVAFALLLASAAFLANGLVWLAIDYLLLAVMVVTQYLTARSVRRRFFDTGYRVGHRAARFEFWQSFHEGVIRRGLHPHEWLTAESERDDPRIAVIVPRDGDGS